MAHTKDENGMVQLVSETEKTPTDERKRRLIEFVQALDIEHTFHKGQLVRWKQGFRNRKMPSYNEAVVVREILATPVFDMCDNVRCAGTPDFGEPLTLVLGLLDPDGDFVELHFDGRRFEPMEG